MWAKFEVISSDEKAVYLPMSVNVSCDKSAAVIFGKLCTDAKIYYFNQDEQNEGDSFDTPIKIKISEELLYRLHIQKSLVYRVRIKEACIIIGPVIGLLLGIHTHRYNPFHMRKYSDRFGIYHKVGGLIYAFSPKTVNWKKQIAYGCYYNIENSRWEYGCFPLPEAIYRRDFHSNPEYIEKLSDITHERLFNSYRFTKSELFEYLGKDEYLSNYLPQTQTTESYTQVKDFIDTNRNVILKPTDLSRGRGICIFEKLDNVYKVTDYRYKHPVVTILDDSESVENFFTLNQSFFNKYIMQRYLSLARIGNSLFDIRVVMQKNADNAWGCTGIECRVSGENGHITNISRGGYALTLDEALEQSFKKDYDELPDKIESLCKRFCSYMDTMGESFAEFGIDIAVDTDKKLWFIEANVFPSFKGFKTMDRQTYLRIRYSPLLYALSLTKFGGLEA